MAHLQFDISEAIDEVRSAQALTEPFLVNSGHAFEELVTQLEILRAKPTEAMIPLRISEDRPIRTIVSEGEFDRQSSMSVFGTVSTVWEIIRVPERKKKAPARYFELVGNASTLIKIFRVDGADPEWPVEIACWQVDVGLDSHPGCRFHVQVASPVSVPIPRLPSIFVTPMSALEFLLSELFQKRWQRHVFAETAMGLRWRTIQQKRFSNLFAWHVVAAREPNNTPWCCLKQASVNSDLFMA
jgi:hypothetical protein